MNHADSPTARARFGMPSVCYNGCKITYVFPISCLKKYISFIDKYVNAKSTSFIKDDDGNTVWNNLEVHSALQTLKNLVKEYYNKEIVPKLFEHEFLK